MSESSFDFVIVGAGIAGASIGYWLAPHGRVLLLEREDAPGYHSTGRSAAMFVESYGPPQVRALTRASRSFFEKPPAGFADRPILTPRGTLLVAEPGQRRLLDETWAELHAASRRVRRLDREQTCALVDVLEPQRVLGAVHDPDASDMDVHALHSGYLRGVRAAGGVVACAAPVSALRREGRLWRVEAGGERYRTQVLVDAAGAWADEVARMAGVAPVGLSPRRRSAFVFRPPDGLDCARWPLCIGADESWYMKPDAGLLLGSPANADECAAQDVQPEEHDIALGIHRIETMTSLRVRRPLRTWAGLRTFAPDGALVGGFDPDAPGFFWLAGQGGYGIQTSAAMGEACAALARGLDVPAHLAEFGLDAAMLGRRSTDRSR